MTGNKYTAREARRWIQRARNDVVGKKKPEHMITYCCTSLYQSQWAQISHTDSSNTDQHVIQMQIRINIT